MSDNDRMREAFENSLHEPLERHGSFERHSKRPETYRWPSVQDAWANWQAAWHARDAEVQRLRDALEKIARVGNSLGV